MYIDIHVHNSYKEKDVLKLQNLFPEQTAGISKKDYYSVGLHPWYVTAGELTAKIQLVRSMISHSNILAVGEIGLDYKIDIPVDLQMKAFVQQLEMAEESGKPVIIHCVRAYNDLLAFRKKSNQKIPWIIHWFNAGLQMAEDLISKNCYLSFGQTLFNEEGKAYRAFKHLPRERIFFETDDVGITIIQVYEKAEKILEIPVHVLREQIVVNFRTCFGKII